MTWLDNKALPSIFGNGQALADWPSKLDSLQEQQGEDSAASKLYHELARFELALDNYQPDASEELIDSLSQLSEYAHHCWHELYDDNEDLVFDASLQWISAIKSLLAENDIPIKIRKIMPGQKFDMDTMVSVESESGHRLKVEKPLSWILLDNAEDVPKLKARGKVITS